jgi:hypothetical protein
MAADFDYTFSGKLSPDLKSLAIDFASTIPRLLVPLLDIPLEINIKRFHKNRTAAQNRWIWGLVIPVVQAFQRETTGACNSKDALYAFFRKHIIGDEVRMEIVDGKETIILEGKKFSQCTTVEFNERIDKITAFYAERGCTIPPPVPGSNNLITDFTSTGAVNDSILTDD